MLEKPAFISGSTRDIFQGYNAERCIIIDEMRPDVISYPDLLRITDPYGIGANLPSRYHDKALACDMIIITTPYSPFEFYCKSFALDRCPPTIRDETIKTDSFEQLRRRISLVLYMDDYYIHPVEYFPKEHKYEYIVDENNSSDGKEHYINRKNQYSKLNRPPPSHNTKDVFNSLFD